MSDIVVTLETPRLVLRAFTEDDANELFEYAKNPIVGAMAGWKPHESLEESRKIIKLFQSMFAVWAIVLKENGKLIGSIGLHNRDDKHPLYYDKELGYAMSEEYWGRGIMTEAAKKVISYSFDDLKLKDLYISHFETNGRSKRVIEKCGFNYVRTLKDYWENYDGQKLSIVCYTLQNPKL